MGTGTRTDIVLVLTEAGGGEVGVPRELLCAAADLAEGDGHLARLQVQQARLVDHVAQQLRQERRAPDDLELRPPDVRRHLHQLAALKHQQNENKILFEISKQTTQICRCEINLEIGTYQA